VRFLIEQAQAERIPQELRPIEVAITGEGGGLKMLLPGLSGTDGDKRAFATDAVRDCLALDKTLPRTHALWQETHDRGLVEWRDPGDRNKGQKATLVGKHVFERLLEEL